MANIQLSQASDYFLQDESTRPKQGEYRPLIFGKEGDDTIIVFDGWAIGGAGNDVIEARKLLLSDYATLAYIDSTNGIYLDLRSNFALDGFGSLDRIVGYFPQIKGSPHSDLIIADDEARWIFPDGGADTVIGGKSGKTMIGVNSVADWSVQVVSDQAVLYTNKLNGDSIEVHNNHVFRDLSGKEIRTVTEGWSSLQSPNAAKGIEKRGELSIKAEEALESNATYLIRSGLLADLDGDKQNEYVLTFTKYPQVPKDPLPVMVLGAKDGLFDNTKKFFPSGAPKVIHSPWIVFSDLNGDNRKDLIFADCLDVPPWDGGEVAVALFDGKAYVDQANSIPDTTLRNYAFAVGNFDGISGNEIFYGAEQDWNPQASGLLKVGTGTTSWFKNPIDNWVPQRLMRYQTLVGADFDADGFDDLLVGGSGWGFSNTIVFGSVNGLLSSTITRLPASPLGEEGERWMAKSLTWPPKETVVSTPTDSIVFDFDNDGLLDVFVLQQKATYYPPGALTDSGIPDFDKIRIEGGTVYTDSIFYTLKNTGQRKFETKAVNLNDLPNRYYFSYHPFDVNGDGYMDLVSHYFTFGRTDDPNSGQIFSTTIFIGNGRGEFTPIEGATVFPSLLNVRYPSSPKPVGEVGLIIPLSSENKIFTGLQIVPIQSSPGQFTVTKFIANELTQLVFQSAESIKPSPTTYSLSTPQAFASEGSVVTFQVATTGIAVGTSLQYTLGGLVVNDLIGGLKGDVSIGIGGKATIAIPIVADQTTEGDETLTLTIQGQSASVLIKDTSLTPAIPELRVNISQGKFQLTEINVASQSPDSSTTQVVKYNGAWTASFRADAQALLAWHQNPASPGRNASLDGLSLEVALGALDRGLAGAERAAFIELVGLIADCKIVNGVPLFDGNFG